MKINPKKNSGFKTTHKLLAKQGRMYNYVAWSYMQHVPKCQRGGVTVWNLTDNRRWIVKSGHDDEPTLFNKNSQKKPAFYGLKRGLKGLAPGDISINEQ